MRHPSLVKVDANGAAKMSMPSLAVSRENEAARRNASSGLGNQNDLLQDLEDLGRRARGQAATGMVVDLKPPNQASHGWRALGPDYAEQVAGGALSLIQPLMADEGKLYYIGAARCAILFLNDRFIDAHLLVDAIQTKLQMPVLCNGIPLVLAPA